MLNIQYFRLKEVSKTKSIIFKGNHGFSRSKLEQLTQHFNRVNQTKTNISCNEIYLVQIESDDIDMNASLPGMIVSGKGKKRMSGKRGKGTAPAGEQRPNKFQRLNNNKRHNM